MNGVVVVVVVFIPIYPYLKVWSGTRTFISMYNDFTPVFVCLFFAGFNDYKRMKRKGRHHEWTDNLYNLDTSDFFFQNNNLGVVMLQNCVYFHQFEICISRTLCT